MQIYCGYFGQKALQENIAYFQVFIANVDLSSIVKNALQPVIVARFIRIHPKTWQNHISMRMEFDGCFEGKFQGHDAMYLKL